MSDLHGLHPSLAQGLQRLLDFEGDVQVREGVGRDSEISRGEGGRQKRRGEGVERKGEDGTFRKIDKDGIEL